MNERKKFDYSWVIIALTFLMVCVVLGFCSSTKGLYISAVCDALDISRSTYSINDSCRYVATAVINLFFGALVAKFGSKKLICAGFISLILSMLVYSVAESIYVFYIGGTLLGIGIAWTTTTMVGYVVNRWCKSNRGTITGAILASNGIGGAIAMQVLSPMIYNPDNPFGFRDSYRLVAVILVVTAVIIMLLFKDKKDDNEGTVAKKKGRGQGWVGIEYSEATKKFYFYAAIVCIFLTGMVLQGITQVAAPLLKDKGIDPAYVATVLSINSISLTCLKFSTGFIYDRFGLRITSNTCMITAVVVMLILSVITNSAVGRVLAVIYAIFAALALPLETVMLPIYANDLFGDKSFSKILGLFSSVNVAGYAIGTPVTNLCFDLTGNYNIAIYAGCFIMVGILICMQFVISKAKKERAAIEAAQ